MMKTFHSLSLFLLLPLLLVACLDEETNPSCAVSIQLVAPEGYPDFDFDGMTVALTSKSGQGTAYTSPCSPTGLARFQVEYGEYAASAHHQTSTGAIFNGRIESILLIPEKADATTAIPLPLAQARTNALVIKEIYYGGCKDKKGKNYRKDQYITLYNNSTETLYLDGLCVAVIDFQYNTSPSPWMEHTDMERIPVLDFAWQFPGHGTEHPLAPGAETTIATNAVDHTGGAYGHPNSVDLSAVEWGFYDIEAFEGQVITPGVKQMKLLSRTNPFGIWYQFSVPTLPIMIFSLPGVDADAYVSHPANREPRPMADDQERKYLMIPRQWVIDCVECTKDASTLAYKRVPEALDFKAIYMPEGTDKGYSLIRRHTTTSTGQVVYQDTNHSAEDMIVSPTPALQK